MMGTKQELKSTLEQYASNYAEEQLFVPQFIQLLKEDNCFKRSRLEGHLTASCWIVNTAKNKALLVHHKKLNRWLQPGGHADGDENLVGVAHKEGEEETGLTSLQLLTATIFDLDIHEIPEKKEVPSHLHYDVRFLFEAEENETLVVSEESNDVKWVAFDLLQATTESNNSILRMVEKVKQNIYG